MKGPGTRQGSQAIDYGDAKEGKPEKRGDTSMPLPDRHGWSISRLVFSAILNGCSVQRYVRAKRAGAMAMGRRKDLRLVESVSAAARSL